MAEGQVAGEEAAGGTGIMGDKWQGPRSREARGRDQATRFPAAAFLVAVVERMS